MVGTEAQIESVPRVDHKEQWKTKLAFLLCYCRTSMRMKEALMSGKVLQALQDLEKIPGQRNYLGNLHMKYELYLIKILFR